MTNKNEAGQALVLTVASLVALMGFAGLAIDMGVMRHDQRLQQTAADAAALAGASNLAFGGVTSGAQDAASRVGYADNGGGQVSDCAGAAVGTICVQVNNPPATGPHGCSGGACDRNYVEALVAVVHPTYFMRALSINSETITARAVASNLGGNGCLYTLGPPSSAIEGVNISGPAILNASSCGIVDDGDYITSGGALTVSADSFGVSGNPNVSGSGGLVTCTSPGPCPTYGIPAATNPLSSLTPPCTSCLGGNTVTVLGSGNPGCGTGCSFSGGTYRISSGTYCSITIMGVASDQVVFSPGVYIIDGSSAGCSRASLNIQGNDTINGTGVTFYFTNSSTLNMTGTPTVNLTAPDSSGTYPGILMYQDPNDTNTTGPSLGGDNGSNYNGALYFPNDQLSLVGGASINVAAVVSASIVFNGDHTVNLKGSAGLPPGVPNPIKSATLVE
jgi:Putative Flp pilus-assembly TadE/G-like